MSISKKNLSVTHWADPIHPGEILTDELEALGISAAKLAEAIGVPKNRMYAIIAGKRGVTADTARRLGAFFGMRPEFWLNLQKSYELEVARQEDGDEILSSITPLAKVLEAQQKRS
ncbi:MAG: plasmid maintenance system antidote protein family [Rickettsiales bacterium]|jgi:addiction module HigA family antidote|nr:plasmid maintenance system antidote protein family [Rickettsiales bacterium]